MRPSLITQLRKPEAAHKYQHGHALVLSGRVGQGGAARLAARGALRVGAGLVTLGCPPGALLENAMRLDAIMCAAIAGAADLQETLSDPRLTALCLGPGLGLARAQELVPPALAKPEGPAVVLDADALSAFASAPDRLFEALHPRAVLTPHAGEFARIFPDLDIAGPRRAEAVRRAAARAGAVVLLKGPETLICDPSGDLRRHVARGPQAAPWLATAGAGDVLAGLIAGLLARGLAPLDAAEASAWLHAACARAFGPGLIAEDLPEMLPKVFRELGL